MTSCLQLPWKSLAIELVFLGVKPWVQSFAVSDREHSDIMSHWPQNNVARLPPSVMVTRRGNTLLPFDVELWFCCYKIPLGQIPIISPPHTAHLSLLILQSFTMFATTLPLLSALPALPGNLLLSSSPPSLLSLHRRRGLHTHIWKPATERNLATDNAS